MPIISDNNPDLYCESFDGPGGKEGARLGDKAQGVVAGGGSTGTGPTLEKMSTIISKQGLTKVYLMSHSRGGLPFLELAQKHPKCDFHILTSDLTVGAHETDLIDIPNNVKIMIDIHPDHRPPLFTKPIMKDDDKFINVYMPGLHGVALLPYSQECANFLIHLLSNFLGDDITLDETITVPSMWRGQEYVCDIEALKEGGEIHTFKTLAQVAHEQVLNGSNQQYGFLGSTSTQEINDAIMRYITTKPPTMLVPHTENQLAKNPPAHLTDSQNTRRKITSTVSLVTSPPLVQPASESAHSEVVIIFESAISRGLINPEAIVELDLANKIPSSALLDTNRLTTQSATLPNIKEITSNPNPTVTMRGSLRAAARVLTTRDAVALTKKTLEKSIVAKNNAALRVTEHLAALRESENSQKKEQP